MALPHIGSHALWHLRINPHEPAVRFIPKNSCLTFIYSMLKAKVALNNKIELYLSQ